jgi:NitT/TauT family transport system substrate-binding protein
MDIADFSAGLWAHCARPATGKAAPMTIQHKYAASRRHLLKLSAGVAALAALPAPALRAQTLDKFVFQTGWRAQAEHGGFYQAAATGLFKQAGLDVEIRMGGPQIDVSGLLMSGRVDMIVADAFSGFNYVRENLPFMVIAAIFQKDPRVLISHPGVGNDKLADLKGKPLLIATLGRTTYFAWLKAKYGFSDDQARPYTFNLAPFLADKTMTVQGLLTSEPMDVRKAGIEPVIHLLADYGFANYQSTLNISQKLAAEKPDVVQRVIDCIAKGWYTYLYGDPAPANALIKKDNPDMTDDKIAFAIDSMKAFGIVDSGDAKQFGIGAMTDARWNEFYAAMTTAGALPAGLDVSKAYSLQFVNKKVGMTG